MSKTLRVAFVCTGNICRSPMAVVIAKQMFEELGQDTVIISGSTLGLRGRPADRHARRAVAQIGLDLTSHRCQPAEPALMRVADHVVVMSPRHTRELVARDPSIRPRIVELWRFNDGEPIEAIADPVGKDYDTFVVCRDLISECLGRWIASLELTP